MNLKNIVLGVFRFLVGGLFIFSGLIKLNDPKGTAIKLHEYFEVFSEDIAEFFMAFVPYALFFAVFLSALEVILGVAVLINYRMKADLKLGPINLKTGVNLTYWILLILIVFFTFLTFYSHAFDKVTDCGCFGDAIKLTPFESFIKDLILTAMIIPLFYFRDTFEPLIKGVKGFAVISVVSILSIWMAMHAINHLPFKDFRAYAVGQSIPNNLEPVEQAVFGPEKYTYYNKKTEENESSAGWDQKFSDTTTYKYVSYERPVLNPDESTPKIPADFAFMDLDGNDVRDELFSGKKMVLVSYEWDECNRDAIKKYNDIAGKVISKGIATWVCTNETERFGNFCAENGIKLPIYSNDATILKTMIRSNPGVLYLENGVVKGKWHYNDFDEIEEEL